MLDPLSDIIALLRPRTVFAKAISGAGAWAVRYGDSGHPGFCAVLEGACLLSVAGEDTVRLEAGDFVLLPAIPGFAMAGFELADPVFIDPKLAPAPTEEVRHGRADGSPDVRMMGGYFQFDSPDADLLVAQLPGLIHLRGAARLGALVAMIREEASGAAAGRDLVLGRLVEILIVEALRAVQDKGAPPGLLRGLNDPRLAAAIRRMHAEPARPWTAAALAKEAALSRSAFFDRFARTVGVPPMEYLQGWRISLAKDLLRRKTGGLAEIAERVGYGSASAFSTAFARTVGQSPRRYAQAWAG